MRRVKNLSTLLSKHCTCNIPVFDCNPAHYNNLWFDFCFTALHNMLGLFGRGQLTYPHCSWASLLGSLPVLSAHSFASN